MGGPVLVSPDGKNRVQPVAGKDVDGNPSDSLAVVISANNVVLDEQWIRSPKGVSDLLWGPPGSRFVVVRTLYDQIRWVASSKPSTNGQFYARSSPDPRKKISRARAVG